MPPRGVATRTQRGKAKAENQFTCVAVATALSKRAPQTRANCPKALRGMSLSVGEFRRVRRSKSASETEKRGGESKGTGGEEEEGKMGDDGVEERDEEKEETEEERRGEED